MNRDIKFRVWDKGLKKMFYPDGNLYITGSDWPHLAGRMLFEKQWPTTDASKLEPSILQQFTNFKDKEEKEIYELDIVLCKRWRMSETHEIKELGEEMGVVFMSSVTGAWTVEFRRYDDFDDLSKFCGDRIELKGNVFENENILPTPWQNWIM